MNKFKLLVAPILIVPFLVNCGGGSDEYKVSVPDTNGVSIYPGQAYKGKEYVGTIEIATDMIDKQVLPDKLDKVTSGNSVLQPTEYTYTLKEDKLTADFKVPAANVVGDIAIQLTLVEKPEPAPVDPSIVTADEFNKAVSFQGVEYMQVEKLYKGVMNVTDEFSPNVYHYLIEGDGVYNERYVTKIDEDSYEGVAKYKENDQWEEMEPYEAKKYYKTPTACGEEINTLLKNLQVNFSSFTYNSDTKDYSYKFVMEEEYIFKFGFNNKQLVSYDIPLGEISGVATITYNETPVVPPQP